MLLQKQAFDVAAVRRDFPILATQVHGKPLVYLDNAATSQKPTVVLDAIRTYYDSGNANIHRGVHDLSQRATAQYEEARQTLASFINAAHAEEIIFVRGATEAINLVASTYGRVHVAAGDEILISAMEHHSNIVPWQMLCEEKGAQLKVIPMTDEGDLIQEEYERLLGPRTRLVALVHVSNALGTINPIRDMIARAHAQGVPVLIDGAQAVPHMTVDVQALDVDFYVFSGHKLFGPTGTGVLYGKRALLNAMPPWMGGGDMISSVSFAKTTYNVLPYKFEAGTPHIAGGIALGKAVDYVRALGLDAVNQYEQDLLEYATAQISAVPRVRLIGTARHKASVVSFVMEDIHPHDIGTILDVEGVAIRTGHHCAQPVMERLDIPATARASMAFYNTRAEIDSLVGALHKVLEVFT